MSIGKLRHRAELQQKVQTPDGSGGYDTQWVEVRTIWAEIKPVSAVQTFEFMRSDTIVTHEIRVRYADDIGTDKRLVHRGRAFRIKGVLNPDERNRWLDLMVEEGVAT